MVKAPLKHTESKRWIVTKMHWKTKAPSRGRPVAKAMRRPRELLLLLLLFSLRLCVNDKEKKNTNE